METNLTNLTKLVQTHRDLVSHVEVIGQIDDAVKFVCRWRILVVDDEVDYLSVMEDAFGKKYIIKTLSKTDGLLDEVVDFKPHLILMDLMMPGIAGEGLAGLLSQSSSTCDITVAFLTATVSEPSIGDCAAVSGLHIYLPKTLTLEELDYSIDSILTRGQRKE